MQSKIAWAPAFAARRLAPSLGSVVTVAHCVVMVLSEMAADLLARVVTVVHSADAAHREAILANRFAETWE